MIITAAQCRAARALLDWSQPDLAKKSGIHVQTISNFEHGNGSPTNKTLETTRKTFENEGIEFGEGEGVRKSLQQIKNFNGQQGFWAFFDDIYNVAKSHKNPDIFITNAKEKEFDKWLSEYEPIHNARMTKLNGPKIRVLLKKKIELLPQPRIATIVG